MAKLPDIIFLCGFSGSGKTETGRRLAEMIGYGFVDTDAVLEEVLGSSISHLFAALGEARFRSVESDILRTVVNFTPRVIALGGGTIAREENLIYAKAHGFLIYLKVTPETAYERLDGAQTRPLLRVPARAGEDRRQAVLDRIRHLLGERERYYLQSELMIDTEGKSGDQVAEEIRKALTDRG